MIFILNKDETEKKRVFKQLIDSGERGLIVRIAEFCEVSERRARAWMESGKGWATAKNERKIEEFFAQYLPHLVHEQTTEEDNRERTITTSDELERELIEIAREVARTHDLDKIQHYRNQGRWLINLARLEKDGHKSASRAASDRDSGEPGGQKASGGKVLP
ncbi:MAG: hypothetical protein ACRDRT_01215 [Pseudonocardiaceae bacterium]